MIRAILRALAHRGETACAPHITATPGGVCRLNLTPHLCSAMPLTLAAMEEQLRDVPVPRRFR